MIFESVAGYVDRGQPDTGFDTNNGLTSVADITPYVLDYARQSDGVLLAWKNIVSTTESCGSSGGGPGDGFPPGGMPPG